MYCDELKQIMMKECCLREEMQKLKQELWNLSMKEVDIATYTNHFNDLTTFFLGMVTPEY